MEQPGLVPVPDPSLLTTEALRREVETLRELLDRQIKSVHDILDAKVESHSTVDKLVREMVEQALASTEKTNDMARNVIVGRIEGMDKAIKLLQDISDRFPSRIDEKIVSLKDVHEQKFVTIEATHGERFNSIQTQFKERDVRTEQSSKDSKVAVDAALQAAKEAVGEQNKSSALAIAKSEASTAKQIDQLSLLIGQQQKGFDDKIADVKDRLTRIEGGAEGKGSERRVVQQGYSNVGMVIAALVGVAGMLIGIAGFVMRMQGR